jgi:hypothetical protein
MQTFLPYADFTLSAKALDWRRLGKQRLEGKQILKILNGDTGKKGGWVNHPATRMWRGHRGALKRYVQVIINEWKMRGYKNTIILDDFADDETTMPKWFGRPDFHTAHQSNLVRKQLLNKSKIDRDYAKMFSVSGDLPYIWPA